MSPKIPKIFWVIIAIAVIFNVLTIIVALKSAGRSSYPKAQTVIESIDYGKLSTTIHTEVSNQISQLPTSFASPVISTNGVNGTNGRDGVNGRDGSTGVAGPKGESGEKGEAGSQGVPGASAKALELRYNTAKAQIEWRYEGDLSWKLLVSECTLTNTCALL